MGYVRELVERLVREYGEWMPAHRHDARSHPDGRDLRTTVDAVFSHSRHRAALDVRRTAWYYLYVFRSWSLVAVGAEFGVGPSTISKGVRSVRQRNDLVALAERCGEVVQQGADRVVIYERVKTAQPSTTGIDARVARLEMRVAALEVLLGSRAVLSCLTG